MNKLVAPLALALGILLATSAAPVAAAEMQPGMWRFTQTTQAGGRSKSRASSRCVSVAQAKDPASYFAPRGRDCALLSHSTFSGRISSTVRCTQGSTITDVTSTVSIESPTHLTLSSTMSAMVDGKSASVVVRGEGKRTGNCRG
jgi:hypothetical protein